MRYCQTTFNAIPPEQVEKVLSTLTREQFVGGQAAYLLKDGTYSIDAGENDIRAIYDEGASVIKFLCRHENEKAFYEKKLQSFAAKHKLSLS